MQSAQSGGIVSASPNGGSKASPRRRSTGYFRTPQAIKQAEKVRKRVAMVPGDIIHQIDENPLFNITTLTRSHWFDPFTAAPSPSPKKSHR